ncbi:hypothetical protein SK128_020305, partial [Halocaridina rubra]
GPDCCSEHLISFHDIDARMMWTLEALLYRTLIHRDIQPVIVNTSTSSINTTLSAGHPAVSSSFSTSPFPSQPPKFSPSHSPTVSSEKSPNSSVISVVTA